MAASQVSHAVPSVWSQLREEGRMEAHSCA